MRITMAHIFINLIGPWVLLVLSPGLIAAQSCQYNMNLVAGQEYYLYNPEYPNYYSHQTSCIWTLRTLAGSNIYLSCSVTLPRSQNCYLDKFYVSTTGSAQFSDAHIYCGNSSVSLFSQNNILTVGLYGPALSPGGRFFCMATAIKSDTGDVPSDRDANCDCGWRQMKRITGGVNTGVNEFPFMVGIIYNQNMWCGGSIISDRFVLTAAHCVLNKRAQDFYLLVGDYDISTGSDTPDSAVYPVSAYEINPSYNANNQQNDIAILQSSQQIYFGPSVGPVCLPLKYTYQTFTGQIVTLIGWGQKEFGGTTSNILQKADVTVISNAQCASEQNEPIVNGEVCTFYAGEVRDACQYDSGGPVVWFDPAAQRFQLIGIISHGVACGISSPAINTRVTEYLEWVINRTATNFCIK